MKSIKEGKFQAPVNIALDLIQGTNTKKACGQFKCNFCMSDFEDGTIPAEVPYDLALQLPKFYSEWGVKSLCIAGHHSDPAIYNHDCMIEFLKLCKKYDVQVGFVTNGAYLSDKLIETLVDTCKWTGFSINAGTKRIHRKITGTDTWDIIIANIKKMHKYQLKTNSKHTIGYKYLITDDNYDEIVAGVKIASTIGIRHFQLRPAELSSERTKKINTELVEIEMKEALQYQTDKFEVFGIREKFSADFTKKQPKRCIASPLGSTWKADGDVVICPDRRWSAADFKLGNFIKEGPEAIKNKWGSKEHLEMIKAVNADLNNCIRCTSLMWNQVYENVIEEDNIDVALI